MREQISLGIMRYNKTYVAFLSDHRMRSISLALTGPFVAMRMYVGDDRHAAFTAVVPKRYKTGAMEDDNASVQSRWIELIIADKFGNFVRPLLCQ